MELARLYLAIVKIAIALALIGKLKSCTLELLGLAAAKSHHGHDFLFQIHTGNFELSLKLVLVNKF